jgi:acetyl-CoA carboxylase biotin carboxyl carrier protein
MNIKEIEDLIKFVAKSGVSEVELESKDFKITIKTPAKSKESSAPPVTMPAYIPAPVPVAVPPMTTTSPAPAPQTPASSAPASAPPAKATDESKYVTIKSPMIGTFYRSASPEKPSFVNIGDEVKPGKVICIIEAMKLFNEIESEVSGKIVKVLVDNASPVEYDQPLFLVDPS